MANRDLVAIGSSAGGVEALSLLCKALPAQFPATILITLHLPSRYASTLDRILSQAGNLPATFAHDGDTLRKGQIFLAPPGCHLIADRDRLLLGKGPRENHARPAVDAMLRSEDRDMRYFTRPRAQYSSICMILRVIFALSTFAGSVAASTDEITLQLGRRFSVYAPSNCNRVEQTHFSLVLDCDFRGTAVRFYMKEFPGQLSEEFDPRKSPASKLNEKSYLDSALHSVADELDPGMVSRLTILSSESAHGDDADALFSEEGYLLSAHGNNDIEKCGFLRVQTYRRGLSAVLFAISDIHRLAIEKASSVCRGVPGEVMTILGSLDDVFAGGRFIWSRKRG